MSRKALGSLILVLGLALVIIGAVVMFVIVPGMKEWPDDVDTVRTYNGTMPVLLNASSFEFMHDLDVMLERHIKTEDTEGDLALVSEAQTLSLGDQPLQQLVKQYVIDRKSMEAVDDYTDAWDGKEGLWDREGLVLGWPIDTEKKDYVGWSDDYRATVPMKFEGEVTHERSDMKTYLFTATAPSQTIDPAQVEVMGLPLGLPKEQFSALIEQTDLSPMIKNMLPSLLDRLEGDTVPLQYYYAYEGKYWIEPRTGVLIDTEKHELRKVGLAEEVTEGTPLASLPDDQKEALRLPVYELTYMATDESVQDAKKDAEDVINQLDLFGTTLPVAAIGIGLVMIIVGAFLALRRS